MEYTLFLNSEEDYNILKKFLRAFEGSWIRPNDPTKVCELDRAIDEAKNGDVVGPFSSAEELMEDLFN